MMRRSEPHALIMAVCVAALCMAGCSTQESVKVRDIPARRVCIADFAPGEADRGVGRSFARRLAEQMRRLTAGTDVMVASGGDMEGLNAAQALREGGVPVDALAAAQDRYAADVLVLGRITAYDPYFRPTLGVSAVALDPADGTVRCSASRLWDAASPDVKDGIDKFYRTAARGDEKQYGRQVYLVSPGYFRRFAAHSLARELVRKLSGSRESAGQ